MAAAGAMVCSTSVGSQKMTKNWREAVKYLHRVDRARFLRRDGSVLTCSWEALKQEMDKDRRWPAVANGDRCRILQLWGCISLLSSMRW